LLRQLASLHEQRVIVKDLKPANVLVEHAAAGTLRMIIADFGISSISGATTATGGMSGTPQSMSPEQFDRATFGSVSTKADIWALGCVLDAMVTGGSIWPADSQPMEIMMTVAGKRGSPEIPVGTAAPLADVIRKCFTTAQADRPTAEQLVSLLQQAATATIGGGGRGEGISSDGLALPAELRGVKVFISYCSAESQDLCQSMTILLTSFGCVVFQPTKDLVNPSQQEMRDAVAASDLVFVIWSPSYFDSKWCRHESHEAAIKNIPLLPAYNGDKHIQHQIIGGLDRRDVISNAVFSTNIVKVQDVSESSEGTSRRIVEKIVKHALRPGQPRPAPAPKQIEFNPKPPPAAGGGVVAAVAPPPPVDEGLVHAGTPQVWPDSTQILMAKYVREVFLNVRVRICVLLCCCWVRLRMLLQQRPRLQLRKWPRWRSNWQCSATRWRHNRH
jgi:serine/threonine protein kinase